MDGSEVARFFAGESGTNSISLLPDGGNINVGVGTVTLAGRLDVENPIVNDHSSSAYDVWIQGGASTASGTARNLALLGVNGNDMLHVNYNSEYGGGTTIGGPVTINGTLNVTGGTIAGGDNLGEGGATTGTLHSKNASGYGYVGADSGDQIRFDDNAGAYWMVNGAWEYHITPTAILPYVNAANDLGATSYKWRNGWFSGTVTADSFIGDGSGLSGTGDNLGNHIATMSLRSDTNNTDDLGTTASKWRNGYFGGTVSAAGFSGSGASLTALNASQLTTGTVAVARIGSGTKNTTTFYRGDGTFSNVLTGNLSVAGTITSGSFVGDGSGLTGIDGDNLGNHIATTTLRSDTTNTDDLGSSSYKWRNGYFGGTVSAAGFSGSGASLTALNASQLTTGTVAVARIGSGTKNTTTFYRGDGTFSNALTGNLSASGTVTAATFSGAHSGDGSALTGVIHTETDPQVGTITNGKWCLASGGLVTCTANPPAGDNLGNHTATTTLAMGAEAITSSAGTIRDANGGWVRTYNSTGWYNGTHGGGWYMTDANYIRSYGGKSVSVNVNQTSYPGLYVVNAANGASAKAIWGNSAYAQGVYGQSASGQGVSGSSGTSYGVLGYSDSSYGVYGKSGAVYGVRGDAGAINVGGVIGYAKNGTTYGILGHNNQYSLFGNGEIAVAGNITTGGTVTADTPTAANHLATKAYVDAAVHHDIKVFATSSTWTAPTGITRAIVTVVGGGGANCAGGASEGATGFSGGVGYGIVNVVPGTTYTITVGAGGASGANGGSSSALGITATGGTRAICSGPNEGDGNPGSASGPVLRNTNIGDVNGSLGLVLSGQATRQMYNPGDANAVAWSSSGAYAPGAAGGRSLSMSLGGGGDGGDSPVGGVGGAVVIEY